MEKMSQDYQYKVRSAQTQFTCSPKQNPSHCYICLGKEWCQGGIILQPCDCNVHQNCLVKSLRFLIQRVSYEGKIQTSCSKCRRIFLFNPNFQKKAIPCSELSGYHASLIFMIIFTFGLAIVGQVIIFFASSTFLVMLVGIFLSITGVINAILNIIDLIRHLRAIFYKCQKINKKLPASERRMIET